MGDRPADILDRKLRALRRSVRGRLTLMGAMRVAAIGSLLTVAWLWLNAAGPLPAWVRQAFLAACLSAGLLAAYRLLVRRLIRPLSLRELARRAEASLRQDDALLSTAAEWIERCEPAAGEWVEGLMDQAARRSERLHLSAALHKRPLIRSLLASAGLILISGVCLLWLRVSESERPMVGVEASGLLATPMIETVTTPSAVPPDWPPRLWWIEPRGPVQVVPHGAVDLRIGFEDDHRVAGLLLVVRRPGQPDQHLPLAVADPAGLCLCIAPYGLQAGGSLGVCATATDELQQEGQCELIWVHVVAPAQWLSGLIDQVAAVARQIKTLAGRAGIQEASAASFELAGRLQRLARRAGLNVFEQDAEFLQGAANEVRRVLADQQGGEIAVRLAGVSEALADWCRGRSLWVQAADVLDRQGELLAATREAQPVELAHLSQRQGELAERTERLCSQAEQATRDMKTAARALSAELVEVATLRQESALAALRALKESVPAVPGWGTGAPGVGPTGGGPWPAEAADATMDVPERLGGPLWRLPLPLRDRQAILRTQQAPCLPRFQSAAGSYFRRLAGEPAERVP